MKSRFTAELAAMRRAAEETQFEPKPNSHAGKIRCRVCLDDGYPGGPWMDRHILHGHTLCCGRFFSNRHAIANHRRRVHS